MRRSIWAIVAGLLLAILGAAAIARIFSLPLAEAHSGELPLWHLFRTCMPIAAFALPGALTAILLAEDRRVRGLSYWLFVGLLLAALAFLTLINGGAALNAAFLSSRAFLTMLGMGLAGGYIYWSMAGRKSGHVMTALALASHGDGLDEHGLRKRCRLCAALTLLLGLLPLALLGWYMNYDPSPMLPAAIVAKAAADGTDKLQSAGLPWAKFAIDNHVGHVTGTAIDDATKSSAFEKAKLALTPMVGLPGVVAYLQNDIAVTGGEKSAPAAAAAVVAANEIAAKAKADEEAQHAAEAKRKADEAAIRSQEESRLAVLESKRKFDEEAALKANAEEARIAEEEAHRLALDAAAKAKAEDAARLAAEAKQRAEDQKRLADELAAQKKADEQARLAAEAEAERKAVEAAHKMEAEKVAAEAEAKRQADALAAAKKLAEAQPAPAPVTPSPLPAPNAQCPGDFSDVFRSSSVRFDQNSSEIAAADAEFLERIAEVAKRCAGYSLGIGGHADRSGDDGYNQKLSLDRATAVRDALVNRGIASERIETQGYASQRPFLPENSREAFALNRRVDFGARLMPATKMAAKAADAVQAPVATPPSPTLPVEECKAEFNRAFFSDTIHFVGSSAIVDDSYADYLDRLATLMLSCPAHRMAIGGHTDRRGVAAFNQLLSEERAIAVRDALIDRNVPESRLSANGYGGQRPFDPGNNASAYALNRRVDFGVAVQALKN